MCSRLTLVLVLMAGVVLGVTAAPWVHGPYTGAPSATEVTISWLATEPDPARIEYWPADSRGEIQVVRVPPDAQAIGQASHVRLTALARQMSYAYRVVLETPEGEEMSATGRFRTESTSGAPVRFFVLADTQWQWKGENRLRAVGEAMAGDVTDVDFILHAGDLVESPSAHNWENWFRSFDTLLLRAPLLPVLGNHERNHGSYYDHFELPPGGGRRDKQWWAFRWGDVVIVGLDTNVKQAAQIIAQQEWARAHLSGPQLHKFVIFHHPVFSSDAYHGSGYSYDVIYHPIFVECGVDIVFTGHAHNYERLDVDGVTYLGVGGGGAVPRALAPERVEGSVVALEGHNFYVRVNASPAGIRVEAVSVAQADEEQFVLTDGHLLDAFLLPTEASRRVRATKLVVLLALLGVALAGLAAFRSLGR